MLLALSGTPGNAPAQAANGTHSPHGNLNIPCQNCHTASAWKPIRAVPEFDHNQTKYPLRGMHAAVACTQCHTKMIFNNVGHACQDCHADIHRRQLGANCEQCHTVRGWQVAVQNIQDHNNRFPLTGAHAAVECDACHKNGANSQFQTMSTDCYSCHQSDYTNTSNPKHTPQGFPIESCDTCHTTDNWLNAKFDHNATGFPLTGMHSVPPRQCTDCHVSNNYNLSQTACVSCHLTDFQKTNNPNHVSANFPTGCEQCHTTSGWSPASFDHNTVNFPLTGAHTVPPRQCSDCHVNNNYNLTSTACVSCHLQDFDGTTNPNHVSGGFAQTCETCHTTTAWEPATFDQSKTAFPLTGSHTVPPRQCTDCHVNNNYNITNTTCVSCHQTDYNNATTPVAHAAAGFPTTCESCHDTVQWTDGTFNHQSTGFALTGAHTVPPRSCSDCHVNNNYSLNSTACVTCHLKDYQSTANPNHVTANFPETCDQCHSTTNWTSATFNHSTTGFALTGAHTVPPRACSDCHVNNNYQLNSTACVTCHLADYQGTTNPNHVSSNFPETCDQCHSTATWLNAAFNHNNTGFPLTGSHTVPPRQCSDCHVNNNYTITNTTCISCHQTDYNNATSPVAHAAAGFPTTCENCHDTVQWTDGTFNHASTGFTLTGSHTVPPRQCSDCHVNNNYAITNTTCISCHQTDYTNAISPVAHAAAGFPTTCENCHDTVQWTDGTFNHASTGFTLTGMHTVPPRLCTDCHVNNNYSLSSTACVTCHLKDYQGTTNPNHVSSNFPQTCDSCHSTASWLNATFDHSTTGFPLTGSHTVPPRQCTDCHINNNYTITNTTCVSCHQTDYTNAISPVNHVAANFPTTCQSCHDTVAWTDGTFNHSSTGFTLTGNHTVPPRQCTDCHVNGNYNITSTTCVSCHQTDYNNAITPVNHVAANFPTTCDSCHDTVLWTDGTFNHASTGFTLTGQHTVPPRACTDCHKGSNPYGLNSTACVTCHLADYNGTTNPNHVTAGFPQQCDLCHDTTVWTDSTFNHNNTAFPLTGAHTTTACALCHVNGNYTTLPTTCIGCHQTDYNNTTNPGHSAQPQFFPSASCSTCHNTTAWTTATFNHTQYTNFSINHGNANGVCSTCHTNSNNYSIFQCTACHGGNNAANFNHPNVNGYVYNSVNCYQCHQSGGGG
jgi:hypothetical protein